MVTVMHEGEVTVIGGREVTVRVIIGCPIIECAIRGSAEKWQIHTQWSHFLRLVVIEPLFGTFMTFRSFQALLSILGNFRYLYVLLGTLWYL